MEVWNARSCPEPPRLVRLPHEILASGQAWQAGELNGRRSGPPLVLMEAMLL